jgi:hypothetical protein
LGRDSCAEQKRSEREQEEEGIGFHEGAGLELGVAGDNSLTPQLSARFFPVTANLKEESRWISGLDCCL